MKDETSQPDKPSQAATETGGDRWARLAEAMPLLTITAEVLGTCEWSLSGSKGASGDGRRGKAA